MVILITGIMVFPVWWMVSGSFQDIEGYFSVPPKLLPTGLHLNNYRLILSHPYTIRWVWNTLLVVGVTCILAIILTTAAGYAFSIYEFIGKKLFFWFFMAALMIPGSAIIIGQFLVLRTLGIYNTLWAAILPFLFHPFGIFFYKNYVDSVPRTIIDSARIDGAGEIRILSRIVSPITVPAIGTLIVFMSFGAMGNYLWQNLVLQSIEIKTLIVGMVIQMKSWELIYSLDLDPLSARMAAGVVLMIPPLLIFIFANKRFIKDLKMGALTQ